MSVVIGKLKKKAFFPCVLIYFDFLTLIHSYFSVIAVEKTRYLRE